MLKKFSAIMILILMLSFVGNVEANERDLNFVPLTASAGYTGRVSPYIDFLALRTGPSVHYDEILRIPPGAYVEVIEDEGMRLNTGFVRVKYSGIWGYAHKNYITRVSAYR